MVNIAGRWHNAVAHGDHICLLHNTVPEQLAVAVPFIQEGLRQGQRCAYIADGLPLADVSDALERADVDVPAAVERGALLLLTWEECLALADRRDDAPPLAALQRLLEQTLATGHGGLWVVAEIGETALAGRRGDGLARWERAWNDRFAAAPIVAICAYNLQRLPEPVVALGLGAHPLAALDGGVSAPNPFFEPASQDASVPPSEQRMASMLAQLQRLHRTQDALRRREEENAVLAEIGRIITSSPDIGEVYERFAAEVRRLVAFDRMSIVVPDADRGVVTTLYASGVPLPIDQERPLAGSIHEHLLQTRRTLVLADDASNGEWAVRSPRTVARRRVGLQSALFVPLIVQGGMVGVLVLMAYLEAAFTEDDVRMAERVAAQIAGVVANDRLYRERVQVEEALRRNEDRLNFLLAASHIGFWEWDPASRRLVWSATLEALYGLPPGGFDGDPQSFYARVHPDDREWVRESVHNAIRTASEYNNEYRIVREDGAVRVVEARGRPLRDDAGQVVRYGGAIIDVTERREAQEALRRGQARFRAIIENSSDYILLVDDSGLIRYASPSLTRFLGLSEDEVVGMSGFDFVMAEDREPMRALLAQVIASPGAPIALKTRRQRRDGTVRWIEGVATNLLDNPDIHAIVLNLHDVTQREETQAALQRLYDLADLHAAELDAVIESIPDAVLVVTETEGVVRANSAALRMFNAASVEDVRMPLWRHAVDNQVRRTDGSAVPVHDLPVARALRGEVIVEESRVADALTGEDRYRRAAASPIRRDDRIVGAVLLLSDVTEQKRIEQALRSRERQQAAVADLGRRALAGDDLYDLMNETVELAARALDADLATVLRLRPDGQTMVSVAGVGWDPGVIGQTVPLQHDSQAGFTLLSHGPVVMEDSAAETRFRPTDNMLAHGVVSGMSVLIPGKDRPFGTLGVFTRTRRVFTQDDVNFFQALAHLLASAVERDRSERARTELLVAERQARLRAEGAQRRLAAQYGLVRRLAGVERPEALRREALDVIGGSLGWDLGAYWTLDPAERTLVIAATWHAPGIDGERYAALAGVQRWTLGQGIVGRVWADGGPVWIEDVQAEPDVVRAAFLAAEGLHGAVFFPVRCRGEVVGVFEFLSRQPRPVDEDLLQTVTILNAEVSQYLEHQEDARLIRELSTPVLPIGERLLVIPVIGVLDADRAAHLREKLLAAVHSQRARAAVIDFTGVASMDAEVAVHLARTIAAARLLGARVVVTGLSSAASHSLTQTGVDVEEIAIAVDLRAGLAEAARRLSLKERLRGIPWETDS